MLFENVMLDSFSIAVLVIEVPYEHNIHPKCSKVDDTHQVRKCENSPT